MGLKSKLRGWIGRSRFRIALPFVAYELELGDLIDSPSLDERIKRLSAIQDDLRQATLAVADLQSEAETRRAEAASLRDSVDKLREKKTVTQEALRVSEEALSKILSQAARRSRFQGLLEGLIVGVLSSLLVWWLTSSGTLSGLIERVSAAWGN